MAVITSIDPCQQPCHLARHGLGRSLLGVPDEHRDVPLDPEPALHGILAVGERVYGRCVRAHVVG